MAIANQIAQFGAGTGSGLIRGIQQGQANKARRDDLAFRNKILERQDAQSAAAQSAQVAQQQREYYKQAGTYILSSVPPEQRADAYKAMQQQAAQMGFDVSKDPPEWGPEAEHAIGALSGYVAPKAPQTKLPQIGATRTIPQKGGMQTTQEFDGSTWNTLSDSERFAPAKPPDTVAQASKLRTEFSKTIGKFDEVNDSYGRVVASAADPSAAGDLALIFNFMKVLDPGSTVREGEFATAQNSGGVDKRIWAKYNSIISGERLAPGQRADFVRRAQKLYGEAVSNYKKREAQFRPIVERSKIDPNDVFYGRDLYEVTQPKNIQARGDELEAEGFSKDEVIAKLKEEGYGLGD